MKILIVQQRGWALKFGIPLAKHLKNKFPDARFAAYVYKISTWQKLEEDDFEYDYLWLGYKFDDKVNEPYFKKTYAGLSITSIEKDLGITTVWRDLLHIDRSMIYTPGKKWRYALQKQLSDETMLNLVRLNYGMVKDEIFGKFNPDIIVLPNFGSLFHNILYHYAKKSGVKCWQPTASKISGKIILTSENNYKLPPIQEQFNEGTVSLDAIQFAKKYIQDFRKEYIPPEHFISRKLRTDGMYTRFFIDLLKLPVRLYKNIVRNRNPLNPRIYRTLDNLPTKYYLKEFFSQFRNLIGARYFRYNTVPIDQEYFYFPLHVQPEVSTNLWAPYFTNQLETIRQVALSLPGRYTLVVKEHPIMLGWRSSSYYKKISGLPNVKLIPFDYPNYKLLDSDLCRAVVCISGTSGFENILLKKPTILLSDMFYEVLPHCIRVNDLSTLPDAVKKMESNDLDTLENERELEKLVAILHEHSTYVDYSSVLSERKDTGIDGYLELMTAKVQELEQTSKQ